MLIAVLWDYNNCLSVTCSMAIVLSRPLSPIIHHSSFLCMRVIGVQCSINPTAVSISVFYTFQSEAEGVWRADSELPSLNKLFPAYYLVVFHVEWYKCVISVLTATKHN
jgi:hypothetical protein